MKRTSKKTLTMVLFALCVLLCAVMLIACNPTPEQKEKAFNTYGKEKAFNKTSGGTVIHLADGTKTYYIPSSVSGDYKTISEYAAAKANTLTSAITINTSTTNSSSSFFFSVAPYSNPDNTNANATNWYNYSTSTGVLSRSEIRYSSTNLGSKNLQYKKHTALHEMGHTFGLGHVNESILNGYTVMLSPHPDSKYELDDYGEFDRANIEWQYGK